MAKKAAKKKIASIARAPGTQSTCEFPCIEIKQGSCTLAVFKCSGKALWNIVKINQKEDDKDEGYQRVLSQSRAERIAAFIDTGNVIPNSILVSFDKGQIRDGKLLVPRKPNSGWVIDGQHRLEGAHRSNKDIDLIVVAFIDLSIDQQIKCFVTINREHKGVPASLYYELLKQLPGSKSETEITKERAADLATIVKRDEESPFYNKIVVTIAPKEGELSLNNWVRKISPLLKSNGRLSTLPDDGRAGVLNNYYKGLSMVFNKEFARSNSIFFKTLGFGAMINALPTFMDLTIQEYKGFRVQDVVNMFQRIKHFDFAGWHQLGSGNAAEITAGNDLRTELTDALGNKSVTGLLL